MSVSFPKPLIRSSLVMTAVLVLLCLLAGCGWHSIRGESTDAVLRVKDGALISYGKLASELVDADVIYIGENHDNPEHHAAQLRIIQGLRQEGIHLEVGLEMFQVEDQEKLDRWMTGKLGDQ